MACRNGVVQNCKKQGVAFNSGTFTPLLYGNGIAQTCPKKNLMNIKELQLFGCICAMREFCDGEGNCSYFLCGPLFGSLVCLIFLWGKGKNEPIFLDRENFDFLCRGGMWDSSLVEMGIR